MAVLNVNPTRMVLLSLKKRVKSASRGHKLLKDKQDGLMKKFMEVIREAKDTREQVERELTDAFGHFVTSSSLTFPEMLESALLHPEVTTSLKVDTKNVMSVRIPQFTFEQEGSFFTYGMHQTNGELDLSLQKLSAVFELLIKLAEIEKSAEALAEELETTRRRVNALEHKLIPDLKETVKFIQMKLGEMERSSIVNTMIIKDKMT